MSGNLELFIYPTIIVIVGIVVPVTIGLLLIYKTKQQEFEQQIKDRKFLMYDEFLNRLSLLYEDPTNTEIMTYVINSYNKFAIYSSNDIYYLFREFLEGIIKHERDPEKEHVIISSLVNKMRCDINCKNKDIDFKPFKASQ